MYCSIHFTNFFSSCKINFAPPQITYLLYVIDSIFFYLFRCLQFSGNSLVRPANCLKPPDIYMRFPNNCLHSAYTCLCFAANSFRSPYICLDFANNYLGFANSCLRSVNNCLSRINNYLNHTNT